MSDFLAAAGALIYPLLVIVGVCVGALIVGVRELVVRAETARIYADQAAFLTAVASDTDAPIHDRLAAEWLSAELDDPRAVERWLA